MIPRYSTELMTELWSEEIKCYIWGQIEYHIACEQENLAIIPKGVSDSIKKALPKEVPYVLRKYNEGVDAVNSEKAKLEKNPKVQEPYHAIDWVRVEWVRGEHEDPFNIKSIEEIEASIHHDVIAFIQHLQNRMPEDAVDNVHKSYVHWGITSSDILDTALSLRMKIAAFFIVEETCGVIIVLNERIKENNAICVARTHGIWAETLQISARWLRMAVHLLRCSQDFSHKACNMPMCVSGPVGSYSRLFGDKGHHGRTLEKNVAEKLKLPVEVASSQIVNRDHHAHYFNALAVLGGVIEQWATNIRILQISEIDEIREPFGSQQKGSSSMPHKRNPIISERLTGMARLLRSYASTAMENIALWLERDISHSAPERIIAPDATHIAHYMCQKLKFLVKRMEINIQAAQRNVVNANIRLASGSLMEVLIKRGFDSNKAYSTVQKMLQEDLLQKALTDPFLRKRDNDWYFCIRNNDEWYQGEMREDDMVYHNTDIQILYFTKVFAEWLLEEKEAKNLGEAMQIASDIIKAVL